MIKVTINLDCDVINNSENIKQLLYDLQKEEIKKEFPGAYLPREKESVEEYILYLLQKFPSKMVKLPYIEDCIYYMVNHKRLNLMSATKELYPIIGKKHGEPFYTIERNIRNSIKRNFFMVSEEIREEIFPITKDVIPTNFFFLYYLTEYIKAHYYLNVDKEYKALKVIKEEELKKIITKFLYTKLGQFHFATSHSQLMLVDFILYFIKNNFISIQQLFYNKEISEKWEFIDQDTFIQKLNTVSAGIENAYPCVEKNTYNEVFGDNNLHRGSAEYIKKVATYLKEQEYVKKLTK